jgi:hypothetical protein
MHKDRTYRGALLSIVIMFVRKEWWVKEMEVREGYQCFDPSPAQYLVMYEHGAFGSLPYP